MTANASSETTLTALRVGANRVLNKPLDLNLLVEVAVELSGSD
jgi:CheY-like chemotaxis protein